MTVYRVKNWDQNFENNRTREMKRMGWTPIPNKFDSDGYLTLMDHERGPAHYAAWVTLVGIAGKCERRGTLMRDCQRPHDAVSLARITRIPVDIFREALDRLVHEICWLEVITEEELLWQDLTGDPQAPADDSTPSPQDPAAEVGSAPQEGVTERKGRERNGKELKRKERKVVLVTGNNSSAQSQTPSTRSATTTFEGDEEFRKAKEAWESKPELLQTHHDDPTFEKLLRTRLDEPYFREQWRRGIELVAASVLCRGEVPPAPGYSNPWRASFRWFCEPGRLKEIIAGKFGGTRDGPEDWLDDVPPPSADTPGD